DRRRRAHAHGARGQCPAGSPPAGALQRRAGPPRRRALRETRAPRREGGRGPADPRAATRRLMAVSGLESRWLGAHLGDAEAAALFSDEAEIAAMVRVEAALARVQGRLGLI